MTYGFVAKSASGALLASSESANYELSQRVISGSRVGNITTYSFSAVTSPVFFVELPVGGRAGILDFTATSVRIIGNGNYPIKVYRQVSDATGFGIAAYDSNQRLTFKATQNILNVLSVGTLGIGGSFSGAGTAVSFPAVASITSLTYADTRVLYTTYQTSRSILIHVVRQDGYGGWESYVTNGTEYTTWRIYANVRTFSWAVKRAVANRTGAAIHIHAWETHISGTYKEVLTWDSQPTVQGSLQPGATIYGVYPYSPTITPNSEFLGWDGIFTKDNRFPYSNGQTINATVSILTC